MVSAPRSVRACERMPVPSPSRTRERVRVRVKPPAGILALGKRSQPLRFTFLPGVLALALLVTILGQAQSAGAQDPPPFAPGRILVKLRPGAAVRAVSAGTAIPRVGVLSVPVAEGQELETIRNLAAEPGVEYAEPNYLVIASRTPSDPLYSFYQWNLRIIQAEAAWDIETGKSNTTIAFLDTGVDLAHPDLAAKVLPGLNLLNPEASPQDDNGHGSHVAGIAAAAANDATGIAGVSWGARILPVKVLDSFGRGTVEDLARGLIWAADNGADVINISGGTEGLSQTLQDAVDYANDTKGTLIVASVGNDGGFGGLNPPIYPAAFPSVVGVAATDSENRRAEFSERGTFVDVAAPGVLVLSSILRGRGDAVFGNNYAYASGTSMSAPHVAGLAALVRSANPALTNRQVSLLIENTAVDLGPPGKDELFGFGRIDAHAAVKAATTGIMAASPAEAAVLSDLALRENVTKSIALANRGGVALDWTAAISPTVPWLAISPTSGRLEAVGPPQALGLAARPQAIVATGTYTTSVIVTGSPNVQNSPLVIPVNLQVVDRLERDYFPLVLHGQISAW